MSAGQAHLLLLEAHRAIDEQTAALEALRSRGVGLVGIVGLGAGLLGTPDQPIVKNMFLVAFGVLVVLVFMTLRSRAVTRSFDVNAIREDVGWRALSEDDFVEELVSSMATAPWSMRQCSPSSASSSGQR